MKPRSTSGARPAARQPRVSVPGHLSVGVRACVGVAAVPTRRAGATVIVEPHARVRRLADVPASNPIAGTLGDLQPWTILAGRNPLNPFGARWAVGVPTGLLPLIAGHGAGGNEAEKDDDVSRSEFHGSAPSWFGLGCPCYRFISFVRPIATRGEGNDHASALSLGERRRLVPNPGSGRFRSEGLFQKWDDPPAGALSYREISAPSDGLSTSRQNGLGQVRLPHALEVG